MSLALSISEVAALLQHSEKTFRRKWRKLVQQHGFPPPIGGLGLVWSRAAIIDWISHAAPCMAEAQEEPEADIHEGAVISMQQHLSLKYGGGRQ